MKMQPVSMIESTQYCSTYICMIIAASQANLRMRIITEHSRPPANTDGAVNIDRVLTWTLSIYITVFTLLLSPDGIMSVPPPNLSPKIRLCRRRPAPALRVPVADKSSPTTLSAMFWRKARICRLKIFPPRLLFLPLLFTNSGSASRSSAPYPRSQWPPPARRPSRRNSSPRARNPRRHKSTLSV